jgi:hypothetical protein
VPLRGCRAPGPRSRGTAAGARAHRAGPPPSPADTLLDERDGRLFALLLDPAPFPAERAARLARAIAEDLVRGVEAGGPGVTLSFGYAVHPDDETERHALLERAQTPRIRMV